MNQHLNTLQNILKVAGLLNGTPDASPIWQRAFDLAMNHDGFKIQAVELQPVLATLGDKNKATPYRFQPQALRLDKSFFPILGKMDSVHAQISKLKKELEVNAQDLTQLLRVLETEGVSVACHPQMPDIAISDAIKMASAVAHALRESDQTDTFVMAGATVSGIQNYLYDIVSKNAAKLLKGRSFYVQLLADSLLEEFISALNLPPYATIYASGGGFYVVIPDNQESRTKATAFFKQACEQIYKKHKTTLFIDWALGVEVDANMQLDAVWDDLIAKINKKKSKRLANNAQLWDQFFLPSEFGGTKAKDPITNLELEDDDKVLLRADDEEEIYISTLTKQQIETGQKLRSAQFWVSSKSRSFMASREFEIEDPFGKFHWLEKTMASTQGTGTLKRINQLDGKQPFVFYGGNKVPIWEETDPLYQKWSFSSKRPQPGSPKSYDDLAQGFSLDRLDILRMDVDGLGTLLSDKANASYGINLARYAVISRSLDWFFKGFLNTLHEKYQSHTIIIYSGGDDLFILGRWMEIMEFAADIRKLFREWVCENPSLTISGGIVLVPGKFPVMQAAKMAADAEDIAKSHKMGEVTKNAITIFNFPLNWDGEFDIVKKMKDEMLELYRTKKITTKSFLTKITTHALTHQQAPSDPRWRWVLAYDLSRYRDTLKDVAARNYIDQIIKDAFSNNQYKGLVFHSQYHYLDLILVAARWTELQWRTEEKNQ